jgi:hypothetical protein
VSSIKISQKEQLDEAFFETGKFVKEKECFT